MDAIKIGLGLLFFIMIAALFFAFVLKMSQLETFQKGFEHAAWLVPIQS